MVDERLTARVNAVNRANDYANKLWPQLAEVFRPLVGKKIYKADGTLLEKYVKLLPEFEQGNSLHVYRNAYGEYSLSWVVKTCETVQVVEGDYSHAYYHETSLYVGSVRDGVLIEIGEQPKFRTDYSAADIEAKRAAYKAAKDLADFTMGQLHPFGEYER